MIHNDWGLVSWWWSGGVPLESRGGTSHFWLALDERFSSQGLDCQEVAPSGGLCE